MNIQNFLFKNINIRQTVAKNTFWLGLNQIGSRLIKALLFIYAARVLGASNYGLFGYASGVVGIFFILSDLGGLTSVLMMEFSRKPDEREQYVATSFFIKIILLTGSFLILTATILFFGRFSGIITLLPLLAISLVFDQLREFLFIIPRSLEKMEVETAFNFVYNLVMVISGFAVLQWYPDVFHFSLVYAVVAVISFIFLFWYLRSYVRGIMRNIQFSLIAPIVRYTLPLTVSSVFVALSLNLDNVLLGVYRASAEIGFYTVAQKPTLMILIIPSLLALSVFPLLSRLSNDMERFTRVIEHIFGLVILFILPVVFGGVLLAKEIMVFLFGAGYLSAAIIFKITLIELIFSAPIAILNNALFVLGKQKSLLISGIISGIASVALNFLLIPRYGYIGAAIASLIVILLVSVWLHWRFYLLVPYRISDQLRRAGVGTTVMVIAVWGFQHAGLPFWLNILFAGAIYLGVLYLLKEPWLSKGEWQKVFSSP